MAPFPPKVRGTVQVEGTQMLKTPPKHTQWWLPGVLGVGDSFLVITLWLDLLLPGLWNLEVARKGRTLGPRKVANGPEVPVGGKPAWQSHVGVPAPSEPG